MKEILIVKSDKEYCTLPATGLQVGRANDEVFLMSNSNYNTAVMQCPMNEENIKKLNLLIKLIYRQYITESRAYMCIIYSLKNNVHIIDTNSVTGTMYVWDGTKW